MTTIIVTHEDNEVDEFQFDAAQRTITLGRRAANDVCIPDLSVSGNHATITLHDDKVVLQDLNSTNGSYVNGQVIQRTNLVAGDEVILGKILVAVRPDVQLDAAQQSTDDQLLASSTPPFETAAQAAMSLSNALPMGESANMSGSVGAEKPGDSSLHAVSGAQEQHHTAADSAERSAQHASEASTDGEDIAVASAQEASEHKADSKLTPQNKTSIMQHPLDGVEHLVVPGTKPAATPMHELDASPGASTGAVIEIKNGIKSGQILPIDKPVTTLGRPGIQIAAIMRKPDGYFLMHIESDGDIEKPMLNSDAVGDEPMLLHSGDKLTVAGIAVEFMLS